MTLHIIPKIHLRDPKTWVEADIICINVSELYSTAKKNVEVFKNDYFENKEIIWSSIFADEYQMTYYGILRKFGDFFNLNFKNMFMTSDGAVYDDMVEEDRSYELASIREQNNQLQDILPNSSNIIKIIKGSSFQEYHFFYEYLQSFYPNSNNYLVYLTGSIRSNPKFFSALGFLKEKMPFFNPNQHILYCYGFNKSSIKDLKELQRKFNLSGIISESFIAHAQYRGNRTYQ